MWPTRFARQTTRLGAAAHLRIAGPPCCRLALFISIHWRCQEVACWRANGAVADTSATGQMAAAGGHQHQQFQSSVNDAHSIRPSTEANGSVLWIAGSGRWRGGGGPRDPAATAAATALFSTHHHTRHAVPPGSLRRYCFRVSSITSSLITRTGSRIMPLYASCRTGNPDSALPMPLGWTQFNWTDPRHLLSAEPLLRAVSECSWPGEQLKLRTGARWVVNMLIKMLG